MKRSLLVALMFVLTAPAVYGQAKLLPPPDAANGQAEKPHSATLGPPTSLPPLVPTPAEVPQHGPPHQMYGREPAHGTKTAGEPRPPIYPIAPPLLPAPLPEPQVCGPVGRLWAELDGLIWWVEGDRPPPLVTTSPSGTPQAKAGVLGAPGTSMLVGGRAINDGARGGFRLNVGYWLDPLQTIGIQAGGFWLANNNSSAFFSSDGSPILARPFLNVSTGNQSAELVAFPGVSSGSVFVAAHSSFDGWDVAIRQNAAYWGNGRIDALVGYRQLRLADRLGVEENMTSLGGGFPAGTQLQRLDQIDTANEFYGAELGVVGEYCHHGWVFEGLAKMAVGWVANRVNINGATLITQPGLPTAPYTGGLLALPSNIGLQRHGEATLIPEVGLNVAYDFTDHLRVRGGYSFLYWDHVDRPGQQIDPRINPSQVPPPQGGGLARPLPTHDDTDIFVHGMNFGVEVRY
jgi:Putative beta barrel porin-7 (BBP7)